MWWLSQSTRRLEAKWELSASEKHVPTSCLCDALRGIHALNSDVLPGASTALAPPLLHPKRQQKVFKIPRWSGGDCVDCANEENKFTPQQSIWTILKCRRRAQTYAETETCQNSLKQILNKTECLAALAWSLQYADCAAIQLQEFFFLFWQNTTCTARSYPNRTSRWITRCYWEPL